ncbi:MAG: hypothetical protein KDK71_05235 [Chlamydiia bacterium]|nr:hypothetical protein [Chlamydiia bacterium]
MDPIKPVLHPLTRPLSSQPREILWTILAQTDRLNKDRIEALAAIFRVNLPKEHGMQGFHKFLIDENPTPFQKWRDQVARNPKKFLEELESEDKKRLRSEETADTFYLTLSGFHQLISEKGFAANHFNQFKSFSKCIKRLIIASGNYREDHESNRFTTLAVLIITQWQKVIKNHFSNDPPALKSHNNTIKKELNSLAIFPYSEFAPLANYTHLSLFLWKDAPHFKFYDAIPKPVEFSDKARLVLALHFPNFSATKSFLNHVEIPPSYIDDEGQTLLHLSIRDSSTNIEIVKGLYEQGLSPWALDDQDSLPFERPTNGFFNPRYNDIKSMLIKGEVNKHGIKALFFLTGLLAIGYIAKRRFNLSNKTLWQRSLAITQCALTLLYLFGFKNKKWKEEISTLGDRSIVYNPLVHAAVISIPGFNFVATEGLIGSVNIFSRLSQILLISASLLLPYAQPKPVVPRSILSIVQFALLANSSFILSPPPPLTFACMNLTTALTLYGFFLKYALKHREPHNE